jgi:hypothetical protein
MRLGITIAFLTATCFTLLAFSGEKQCSAATEAIPLCDVLADAAKYDGKDITIRGVYYRVIHGSILTTSACEKTKVNMRSASDWKADKHALSVLNSRARKNQGTDIVLRGTFRVARDGCFGQTRTLYEIEEHELLCAESLKSVNSSDAMKPKGASEPMTDSATTAVRD